MNHLIKTLWKIAHKKQLNIDLENLLICNKEKELSKHTYKLKKLFKMQNE